MSQNGYSAPQPEPKRKMSTGKKIALGCGIPTVLALLLVGGCTAFVGNEVGKSVNADQKEDDRALKEDVEITDCRLVNDAVIGRNVQARVKIYNNGKKRASYSVEGEYLDSDGNKVGELLATVENLSPATGTSQNFGGALISPEDLEGVTKGECKIIDVSRSEFLAAN